MDNMQDDYLTNLSWLKVSNTCEVQSTGDYENFSFRKEKRLFFQLVECSDNYIDDDLQCLCWIIKMRPTSCSSHSLKRLSCTKNRDNHYHNFNRSTYVFDRPSNLATIDTRSTDDNSTSRRILMVRTLNNHLSPTKSSQQSFILIRSSNGKISCLSIRHFV